MNEFLTVENEVMELLRDHPKARNDDKFLQMIYLHRQGIFTLAQYATMSCTNFETIRRVRARIQSRGQYPPDENAKKNRITHRRKIAHYVQYNLF